MDAVERPARDPADRRRDLPARWYSATGVRRDRPHTLSLARKGDRFTETTGDLDPGVTAGLLPGARPRTRWGPRSRFTAAPRPPAPSGRAAASPRSTRSTRSQGGSPATQRPSMLLRCSPPGDAPDRPVRRGYPSRKSSCRTRADRRFAVAAVVGSGPALWDLARSLPRCLSRGTTEPCLLELVS